MLKRNGKLGIDIAGIEPVSLRNQKGGLPTEPRWGLTAADGVCRNLRICICGCFVATLHRNCRSLGLRVLSEHHDAPNTRKLRLDSSHVSIACDNVFAKDYDSQAQCRAGHTTKLSHSPLVGFNPSSTPNVFSILQPLFLST